MNDDLLIVESHEEFERLRARMMHRASLIIMPTNPLDCSLWYVLANRWGNRGDVLTTEEVDALIRTN